MEAVTSRRIKPEDRISALPDSVIQHILSFLPTTIDAVRTSILSKAWRRQWTHLPDLIFKPCLGPGEKYFRFIEDTLALHESPRIRKFHLRYGLSPYLDPHLTSKICFAITKGVKELLLVCNCLGISYLLPEFLIQSASLVRLEIEDCYINSDWTVNLPSLKSLKMDVGGFRANDCNQGIGNLVSGCPLLEWLEISGNLDDDVAIVSKSLKVLSFVRVECLDAIEITCPNLVEFSMNCSVFPHQMIENVLLRSPCIHSLKLVDCSGDVGVELVVASTSLKELHLEYINGAEINVSCPNLVKLDMLCCHDTLREVVNLPSTVCATLDYIYPTNDEYVEIKLLELFQHVSRLTIRRSLVEIISDLDQEDRPLLPVLKSKCLALDIGASFGLALPGIAYALGSPVLETLVINLDSEFNENFLPGYYEKLISSRMDFWKSNRSTSFTCLVSHLKTVEITGLCGLCDDCEIVLDFIEYLLKNARVLEKMIVSLEKSREGFVIKFSQKLLSFSRYSRCVNVELLCLT